MKTINILLATLLIVSFSACYSVRTAGNSGKVPPGQAKKANGSKSAKPYAPGQRKN